MKKFKRSRVINRLKNLFSQIIRLRDNYTCQRCGKKYDKIDRAIHTSHIWPVGTYRSMRFEIDNAKLLCYYDHINWWHKNPMQAGAWVREFLGKEKYAKLLKMSQETILLNEQYFREKEEELNEQLEYYKKRYE